VKENNIERISSTLQTMHRGKNDPNANTPLMPSSKWLHKITHEEKPKNTQYHKNHAPVV